MRVALDPTLYLVTDTALCGGRDGVVATVRAAVAGGVTAVQVRDHDATTRELVALAAAVREALAPLGVPLIVDDRVDVALAVGADGVHVGQQDLDPLTARRLLGQAAHIGLSVHTPEQARAAAALPAGTVDLLGVGPVLATASKPDAAPPIGVEGLARICALAPVPCVAIGGVDRVPTAAVRAAGAEGIAVISAVCGRPDPRAAAAALVGRWREAAA